MREEALGSAHNVPPPGFAGGSRDEAFETFDLAKSSWRQDLAEAPASSASGAHAFDISEDDVSAVSAASAAPGVADVPVGVDLWLCGAVVVGDERRPSRSSISSSMMLSKILMPW